MITKTTTLKSNIMLLFAAVIWGSSFVAQRIGMEYIKPFTFNTLRFAIGSLSLLPIIFITKSKRTKIANGRKINTFKASFFMGLALFLAASLQQIGIVNTSAGKAGFITGLYVIIVPILGIFFKHKTGIGIWIGAVFAVIGMFFLSATNSFAISQGDLLVLIGAFFWAVHVLLVNHFIEFHDGLILACLQFMFCAVFSLIFALVTETLQIDKIILASKPIIYSGVMSVGVAFTLQVLAQKNAHPVHSVIILSLESVFAVLSGLIILHEVLNIRGIIGCVLMISGMLFSQLWLIKHTRSSMI